MKKFLVVIVCFFSFICSDVFSSSTIEELYQRDADIIRMQHFDYYAKLLDEYYQKKKKYPFQSTKEAPVYVFILNKIQEKYFIDNNPIHHYRISDADFFTELAQGVGRSVDEKYDPQNISTGGRPSMYIYMIDGNRMFFAVHLFSGNAVSREVSPFYHKVELSDISVPQKNIYTYKELEKTPEYKKLISQKAEKQAYFDALDEKNSRDSLQ